MRIITAVILLVVHFISQYEKHIGYANCEIVNYFKADGNKCDCEQLLEENGDPVTDNSTLPVHIHHHSDESYFPPLIYKASFFTNLSHRFSLPNAINLAEGNWPGLDRPPQKG